MKMKKRRIKGKVEERWKRRENEEERDFEGGFILQRGGCPGSWK